MERKDAIPTGDHILIPIPNGEKTSNKITN